MLSRLPGYVLLAAFVTAGSTLAARTDDQAGGQATKPAGKPADAEVARSPEPPQPPRGPNLKPAQAETVLKWL
jgi:hypothetical protein